MFRELPDDDILLELEQEANKMFYATLFGFLKAINGIRPALVHGLLAPASMGKSTLTRSIIAQTTESCKVAVLLSEESAEEYAFGFKRQKESVDRDNIVFLRESELVGFGTKKEILESIVNLCISADVKVLFWDNITTGKILGDSVRPEQMADLFEFLKSKLRENRIALFYVAHTNKTVKAEQSIPIQGEDIRGSAQIFNQSDYFFILQSKTKNNERISYVKIAKHRFHSPKFTYYVLDYQNNKYTRDIGVSYDKIMSIFEKEKTNETSRKKNRIYS